MSTTFSSGRSRVAAVAVALAVALVGTLTVSSAPVSAACPVLGPSARWISPYTVGDNGSNWSDGFLASSGTTVTGSLTSLNGSPVGSNEVTGTLSCGTFTGTLTGIAGVISLHGTLLENGNEFVNGTWSNGAIGGTWSSARVVQSVEAADATELTTDPDSSGATPSEPVQVGVTSPNSGAISIATGSAANPVLAGYQLLGQAVHIQAPPATAETPLGFEFVLDGSTLLGAPAGEVAVFRNGQLVSDCLPDSGSAAVPDPCVAARVALPGGDVKISVRTSAASIWGFGVNASRAGFRITSTFLPGAQLGQPYSSALAADGGTGKYRWKKLTKLPKGLRLKAKTGEITGTPKKVIGTFTVGVEARYKTKAPKQPAVWHRVSRTFIIVVA